MLFIPTFLLIFEEIDPFNGNLPLNTVIMPSFGISSFSFPRPKISPNICFEGLNYAGQIVFVRSDFISACIHLLYV